jgi:hypothetical protein
MVSVHKKLYLKSESYGKLAFINKFMHSSQDSKLRLAIHSMK